IMMWRLSVVSKRLYSEARGCFLRHCAVREPYGCNHCRSAVLPAEYLPLLLKKAVLIKEKEVLPEDYIIFLAVTDANKIPVFCTYYPRSHFDWGGLYGQRRTSNESQRKGPYGADTEIRQNGQQGCGVFRRIW